MRAQALLLSSALLWVACTRSSPGGDAGALGGDAGAAEQASGERLKIRALVNDDGSVIVDEDIIDTGANGAVCRPKRFSDGRWALSAG